MQNVRKRMRFADRTETFIGASAAKKGSGCVYEVLTAKTAAIAARFDVNAGAFVLCQINTVFGRVVTAHDSP